MHRVKQNKEGKKKQEVVAAEGKPNEEKCFKLTGGPEGSRGGGEVPRQQQRWFERGAAKQTPNYQNFQPSHGFGSHHPSWGSSPALGGHRQD